MSLKIYEEVEPQYSLVLGLSSFTTITNLGSSAGQNPANEAFVFPKQSVLQYHHFSAI
jgi:hypothetical protein